MIKALPFCLLLAACSAGGAAPDGPLILATTSILGDITAELVGAAGEVRVLLPVGADPHDYAPSAADAVLLRKADLVVAGGLGLEAALEDALDSAASEGVPVVRVGLAVDPVLLSSGDPDPHFWLDPVRMDRAVVAIGEALEDALPGATGLAGRLDDYRRRLADIHGEMVSILEDVPVARRLLVTGHDALRYFADRYGFEVVGVVVPGGSTLAAPGAGSIARLAEEMGRLGLDVVFTEVGDPIDIINALAGEVEGGAAVISLHVGSLGPAGSGADTYFGLLVGNARAVADALGP